METKEELIKKLRKIEEKEKRELIEKFYPQLKSFEGKCFRIKNSYGSGQKWWMYVIIKKVEKNDAYLSGETVLSTFSGISFQTDCFGNMRIEPKFTSFIHSMSEKDEITRKQFNLAFFKFQLQLLNTYQLL